LCQPDVRLLLDFHGKWCRLAQFAEVAVILAFFLADNLHTDQRHESPERRLRIGHKVDELIPPEHEIHVREIVTLSLARSPAIGVSLRIS